MDNLKIACDSLVRLYCDNKSTISIVSDAVKQDQTKYVEVGGQFI